MRLTSDEIKSLYQEQTSRPARRLAECLTPEALSRAATGEVSQAERERLADHLMACADCAQEYRLARSLHLKAEQVATPEEKPAPNLQVVQPQSARRAFSWRRLAGIFSPVRLAYTLAMSLFVVSLALGAWIVSLRQEDRDTAARHEQQLAEREKAVAAASESLELSRQQFEEEARRLKDSEAQIAELRRKNEELSRDLQGLSQPQLNAPIIHLVPPTRSEGRGNAQNVEVAATAKVFTLVLNVTGGETHSDYALEIENGSGKIVWRGRGLRKSPRNTFTLTVPRRLIPAGQYQVKLYGLSAGKRAQVADYAVQVMYK